MIAGPYPVSVRIIRTRPGALTGDTIYETEDGRVWVTTSGTPAITGVTYASVEGDRMISPPRSYGYPPPRREPRFFDRPKPVPMPEEAAEAPRPRRKPKALQKALEGFVGAGPMKRRWR